MARAGADPDRAAPRTDALLDGRVRLRQPSRGYRVAVDPVLLAAACPAEAGARVLDLGCGVGAAALCLVARVRELTTAGLELQPVLAALAAENAALNGWPDRFRPVVGDARRPPLAADGVVDHVLCNPPYHRAGHGHAPADPMAHVANVETAGGLADFVDAACRLVRRKGTVTVIHRADRLAEVLACLDDRTGERLVIPVRPKADADASRVVVRARPGVATPMRIAPDLVLHTADGAFTAEAAAILRAGAALTR